MVFLPQIAKAKEGNLFKIGEVEYLDLTEAMDNIKEGYTRKYHVIRKHNDIVEILDIQISEDDKSLSFETDQFSAYRDIEEITNPKHMII